MINVLDKKGKPLGHDHDYEYRGPGDNGSRNSRYSAASVTWGVLALLFAILGVVLLFNADSSPALAVFCFVFAGLFIYLRHSILRRSREFREFIRQNKTL